MGALAAVKATPTAPSPSAEKPNLMQTVVINAPAVRIEEYRPWACFQIGLGPLEESRKVLGTPPGHPRRLDELFGRIRARRF